MRTNKKHFNIFKKECKKWISIFGLKDWYIDFYHEDWSDNEGYGEAWCSWDLTSRTASLCLSTEWDESVELSIELLRRAAFHEVLHVVFGKIYCLGALDLEGNATKRKHEVVEEVHRLIRLFETVVFCERGLR